MIALPAGDSRLLQITAAATAESIRLSGAWVVCRPGCTQCCYGPFAISQLDALRLRHGMVRLSASDPARASAVRARAAAYMARMEQNDPCGAAAAISLDEDQFPVAVENAACAALDPETGCCDVYEARPLVCRVFGPAIQGPSGAVGACELCYDGASDEEIARCAVALDTDSEEADLATELELQGLSGATLVACALL